MSKPRILIIDDDLQNLALLDEFLSQRYAVETVSDPKKGLSRALASPPDLAIIDVDMPGMDGFEVCESIRSARPGMPPSIIFLTSDAQASSMQRALKAGANDYLTKPFRMAELVGRVELRLGQAQIEPPLRIGNLVLDPARVAAVITVAREEKRVRLSNLSFRVMQVLLKNEERIVSRDQLLDLAWAGQEASDRAVDLHIFRLRRALKGWDHEIETVYGRGYVVSPKKARRKKS